MAKFNVHLVSDATGETVLSVARACLAQYSGVKIKEHVWSLVRSNTQTDAAIAGIEKNPGIVLYTLVNKKTRNRLEKACTRLEIPCIAVLNPVIAAMGSYFSLESREEPGRQHIMEEDYFGRIDAMNFVMAHDDGQSVREIEKADVILVGVSRMSKTPTCLYLANRGIKAANVPIIPGHALPDEVINAQNPVIIGITKKPATLVQIRRSRLSVDNRDPDTDYADIDSVRKEVMLAKKVFKQNGWPVIDATRRSIEEIATMVFQLLSRHGKGEI